VRLPTDSVATEDSQLAAQRQAPERDNEPMPRRAWDAPLVGRAVELATLEEAMTAAGAGFPAVVLIAGEAGIGKSRLAAEAATRAVANGWQVLSGGCLDLAEASVPYLPLVDALRELSMVTGGDALPPLLRRWLEGEAQESATPLPGELAQAQVYAAYLEVLRNTSSTGSPLALAVEDLHWADRGTRDLLSYLVRRLTPRYRSGSRACCADLSLGRIPARICDTQVAERACPSPLGHAHGPRAARPSRGRTATGRLGNLRFACVAGDLFAIGRQPLLRRGARGCLDHGASDSAGGRTRCRRGPSGVASK
jgi:hypothetical protein